jgi:hypothetical protein
LGEGERREGKEREGREGESRTYVKEGEVEVVFRSNLGRSNG